MTKADFEYSIDYAYRNFLQELTDLTDRHKLPDEDAVDIVRWRVGSDVADSLEEWLVDDD